MKELYGVSVSSETVSNITNRINDSIKEWQSKPLQSLYPVIFMDGIVCKVRVDGAVQNYTVYACIGIDSNGHKEVLRITLGRAESAKFWLKVMNDLKARGIQDVLIFCTDNLTGLTEAIKACYPKADHQKCIVHKVRNSVKHVPHKDRKEVCQDLKKIYQASDAETGFSNLEEFSNKWDSSMHIYLKVGLIIGKNYLPFGSTLLRYGN